MVFPRVDVYNAYSGSTALVQYIGSAQDLVAISGIIVPPGLLYLVDAKTGLLRSQSINGLASLAFSNGVIQGIGVTGRLQVTANSNGVANWIIWTGGASAESLLKISVDIIT